MGSHMDPRACNCPDCPTHSHNNEWECTKDCVAHGPFPTSWIRVPRYYHPNSVVFARYTAPWTVEERVVMLPEPEVPSD